MGIAGASRSIDYASLDASVRNHFAAFRIVQARLYRPDGTVTFSYLPNQVGQRKRPDDSSADLREAFQGEASLNVRRLGASDNITGVDLPAVLGTYVPEEGPYDSLPASGFGADYVRSETARAVAAVEGRCRIYPGIDVDIPTGQEQATCSREGVKAAVLAAFAGGAAGVVLSRKYSEMQLDHLARAGDALRELGN